MGGRMSRIEVAGDICLRKPRPTQSCRADDGDDDDDDDDDSVVLTVRNLLGKNFLWQCEL